MSAYLWQRTAAIAAGRVVGILRSADADSAVAAGEALVSAGLSVVEVSLVTPDALDAIRTLAATNDGRMVGAGTVLDEASARLSILAGATFLVCPTVVPEVIACGNRYGVPVLAGAQTPTEAVRAAELGAALVKLFPALELGPASLKAVRAALPHIGFVPTGGITGDNAGEWFAVGAVAVGVGGSLTSGAPESIRSRVTDFLACVGDGMDQSGG